MVLRPIERIASTRFGVAFWTADPAIPDAITVKGITSIKQRIFDRRFLTMLFQ